LIKQVKNFNPKALINSEKYRRYVENFESEILRGISKLILLYAVKQKGEEGIYGYKLARDLKKETENALIIKEGTLYPILRKLKVDGLLTTKKKEYNGRLRSYYMITHNGRNIYNHLTGLKNDTLVTLSSVESDVWSDSVRVINTNTGKQDIFTYGKEYLVEEHIVVDTSQKEGNGYLVGTALHVPSKRTCVNIFKASRVSEGPICRAWLPHSIPLGFHGNFMSI